MLDLKRLLHQRSRRFREKHRHSLVVRAFSSLLFHALEQRKKRPMLAKQVECSKRRWLRRWVEEYRRERQLQERARIYGYRRSLKMKRQIVVALYLSAQTERRLAVLRKRLAEQA